MPAHGYVPPTGSKPTDVGFARPRREVGEQHLRPLRVDDDWRVVRILDKLPAAEQPSEMLGLLLVAAAVTQGPVRLLELTDKASSLVRQALPRLERLAEDPSLAPHRRALSELVGGGRLALEELPEIRTRTVNEIEVDVRRPYGLRLLDLEVLASHVRSAVGGHELTRRPGAAGVGFGRRLFENAPDLELGETWKARLLGSAPLRGAQLYWPESYRRLLLVFDDGRLAYDPGAPSASATGPL